MTKRVTIIDVKDYVGQEVTIGAWVANKSGKGKIAFLQLRDGTAFFQGVVFKPNFVEKFGEEVGLEKFDVIKRLSQETSVYVTGIVKEDERSKFGYELDITDIEVIGESQDYPITPKEHGTDFLMDNRHLWLRSRKQVAVMQIRNAIIYATYEFFDNSCHINRRFLTQAFDDIKLLKSHFFTKFFHKVWFKGYTLEEGCSIAQLQEGDFSFS